ncbi:MAG: RNA-directed DNA polymerase [Deltaproteobacteria bacterium]|nr:RNA-directed DNA polymerase [Deltaproteobacteria bacterium]
MSEPFERWTSVRSLWAAARRAARGKRHRGSVARVLFDLEAVVLRLERSLRDGSWRPGRPRAHLVRDPKSRLIHAAPFEDRIVHQALCAYVGPLLDRHLVADSFACRTGLGTHAALRRAERWARGYRFFVHLDVCQMFPSVDHAILLALLARDIPCERTLEVCARILEAGAAELEPVRFHFPGDDLFSPLGRAVGLPIGNLTSQHFANRFLSPLDHRAKDRLRIRAYLRYMDDMLLFADEREPLAGWATELERAAERIRLRLHPWQVRPTRVGVTFLGFRILPDCTRVKRSSVARAVRKLEHRLAEADPDRFAASLRSVFAHWEHVDTYRLRTKVLRELGLLAGDVLLDDDENCNNNKGKKNKS